MEHALQEQSVSTFAALATNPWVVVPVASAATLALLAHCYTQKSLSYQKTENAIFGLYAMQGQRTTMEDTRTIIPHLQGSLHQSFYAVYDGHNGRLAADYAHEHLITHFLKELNGKKTPQEALNNAFLTTDQQFRGKVQPGGTTAVVAFIDGMQLYCAWAGDSRAIVVGKDGKIKYATKDHKPNAENELKRITDAGGFVTPETDESVARLGGNLACSRALGNTLFRQQEESKGLIPDPEIEQTDLADGDTIILASDGLWDDVTNKGAATLTITSNTSLDEKAKLLAQTAFQNGSVDNITVIIVPIKEGGS